MTERLPIIASLVNDKGNQFVIYRIVDDEVYMAVDGEREWYKLRYEIVDKGTYNRDTSKVKLPYLVHDKRVYSIDEFHDWTDK